MSGSSHLDEGGRARMVDLAGKEETDRRALAGARVEMGEKAFALLRGGGAEKGDVLAVARIAGIGAAKRAADLIPLCHPLPLSHVGVDFQLDEENHALEIRATAACRGRTGVEMEALAAVSLAALTVYDMLKSVDRGMRVTDIRLLEKAGGKSGLWRREKP